MRHANPADSVSKSEILENAVLRFAREHPQMGQARVAERLTAEGLKVSASGVRYIWKKHNLETTAKRLQGLSASKARLNDAQKKRLARAQQTSAQQSATTASCENLDRRQLLLDTAAALFAENGFDRTSMRDIANRAGLLPGSVYHHYPSKLALFLAIHEEGLNSVMGKVRNAAAQGSDPWDSLCRALTVHIDSMVGEAPSVERITGHGLSMAEYPELREQLQPFRERYEAIYRDLIDQLPVPAGKSFDRSLFRLMLLGAANWVFVWYRKDGKKPEEIALAMTQLFRHGYLDNAS